MTQDPVESRGRLTAQCSQLITKIKDDPASRLTADEVTLLELMVKIFKIRPFDPDPGVALESRPAAPSWRL